MSKFEIKMPKLGESITEGTIVSWSVKVGDMIQEDDVLFEVNTAKVSAEIPSPVAGKVVEILYKEGDTVAVGTVVAIIDLDGEESSGTEPINVSETSPSLAETARNESANTASKPVVVEEERWYSPVVIQLAREAKIPKEELDAIQGTGYEGRLSKKDIKDYIVITDWDKSNITLQQGETQDYKWVDKDTLKNMKSNEIGRAHV